jgi:hypothetical protein
MKTNTVLNALANAIVARANCAKLGNNEWYAKHDATIEHIEKEYLPSGCGIDSGTKVDLSEPRGMCRSNGKTRIVLVTAYHHMNENGMYDVWTEHEITIVPNLLHGYTLKISGSNRNDIKEYLNDVFCTALDAQYIPEETEQTVSK